MSLSSKLTKPGQVPASRLFHPMAVLQFEIFFLFCAFCFAFVGELVAHETVCFPLGFVLVLDRITSSPLPSSGLPQFPAERLHIPEAVVDGMMALAPSVTDPALVSPLCREYDASASRLDPPNPAISVFLLLLCFFRPLWLGLLHFLSRPSLIAEKNFWRVPCLRPKRFPLSLEAFSPEDVNRVRLAVQG